MSYTVTTWGGRTYPMDDANGKRLLEKWTNSDEPFPVNIGKSGFKSSDIRAIDENKVTEADLPRIDKSHRLKSDNRSDEEQFVAARKASALVRKELRKKGLKV